MWPHSLHTWITQCWYKYKWIQVIMVQITGPLWLFMITWYWNDFSQLVLQANTWTNLWVWQPQENAVDVRLQSGEIESQWFVKSVKEIWQMWQVELTNNILIEGYTSFVFMVYLIVLSVSQQWLVWLTLWSYRWRQQFLWNVSTHLPKYTLSHPRYSWFYILGMFSSNDSKTFVNKLFLYET